MMYKSYNENAKMYGKGFITSNDIDAKNQSQNPHFDPMLKKPKVIVLEDVSSLSLMQPQPSEQEKIKEEKEMERANLIISIIRYYTKMELGKMEF